MRRDLLLKIDDYLRNAKGYSLMKHIEISTSNHVAIEYELASVSQRSIATIVDIIIVFVWLYLIQSISA